MATEPHISIVGHTTQAALLDSLRGTNQTHLYSGFMNRYLIVCAQRSQKKARLTGDETKRLTAELGELGKQIRAIGEFIETLNEVRVDFDEEAGRAFEWWYEELEDGDDLLSAVTDRAEAHVCRLAMIEAVLDQSTVIRKEHLDAALAIWRYCRDSAEYVFSKILPQRASVDKMASAIMEALEWNPEGLCRTEIYRDVFGANKTSEMIDEVLHALEQAHRVFSIKELGSRQPERWFRAKAKLEVASAAA